MIDLQGSSPGTKRRSDNIRSGGAEYFDQIVTDREEETLHLEFKTLPHDGGKLTKDDRKLLAEAVTGMANAEGGVLVVGIRTQRTDNIDVAIAKHSVKQLQRTTNLVRAAIPEMLSPQHTGIDVFFIEETGSKDEGFIVIDVPESSDRPHYSNVHHQYFRRGSDRTRVMEHGEVRDLMFATREGQLDLMLKLELSISTSDLMFGLNLALTLQNVGRVPVKSPYIRIAEAAGWRPSSPGVQPRRAAHGTSGFYPPPGEIVHVHDELGLSYRETGLDFRWTDRHRLEEAIEVVKRDRRGVIMRPFREMTTQEGKGDDQPVQVNGFYGAENVAMKTFDFAVDKNALLEMFCKAKSIEWSPV
ncbi:helix-turn-helix domain-containing protein [Bradyrhizobium sp. YCK136]|uniref:helix-turn-helix domain-containing protein n=1 Tax=Bradyrhizobium sp. YCK136 TaxID=3351346 RepID=UPI0037C8514B